MTIGRRAFLGYAAAGCACCAAPRVMSAIAAEPVAPHWTYDGATGPDHWGALAPEFQTCAAGLRQTPIDLVHAARGEAESVAFDYEPVSLRILNNGHTIQANTEPGAAMTIADTRYDLVQFHFHHPSEHQLDGKAFDMEAHFVHKSEAGSLAVVGVFMTQGVHNAALEPVFAHMPSCEGPALHTVGPFDPSAFLPATRTFFRYTGSLTTPPCSEGLTWTVFREPIEASAEQIRRFAVLFPNNARPVQPANDRLLIETGGS